MAEKNVNKVEFGGDVLIDLTKDTVTPQSLAKGVTAHDASGAQIIGSMSVSAAKKDINFYDYDGMILHSYSLSEIKTITALPSLPTRDGLVCQGWNYDLATIKARTKPLDIGAVYNTNNGSTRLYIALTDSEELTMPLQFKVGSGTATVNWGDGSSETVASGALASISHEYAQPGDYVISISGPLTAIGGDAYNKSVTVTYSSTGSLAYSNAIRKAEIGSNVAKIGTYAFKNHQCLKTITIANSVTQIGNYAFDSCYSLEHVTIPDSVTSLGTYMFNYCYSLASAVIPDSVSMIYTYAFAYCNSLTRIVVPESITNIGSSAFMSCYTLKEAILPDKLSALGLGSYAFGYCYSLDHITIPSNVTKLDSQTFMYCRNFTTVTIPSSVTSLGNNAFQYCSGLSKVIFNGDVAALGNYVFSNCAGLIGIDIPETVASVGTYAFEKCYSLRVVDCTRHTTIPTLANVNAFSNANDNYVVKVPASLYNNWRAAENWSSIASHIVSDGGSSEPAYTNVLPTAIDKDGSIFDDDGYAKDKRYKNSSSAFVDYTGTYCTGFIKVTPGVDSVIRLKNVRMNPDGDSINACHLLYFKADFTNIGTSNSTILLPYHDAVQNEDGDIIQFTINAEHNASYFILNTSYIGADSIITINEPIDEEIT